MCMSSPMCEHAKQINLLMTQSMTQDCSGCCNSHSPCIWAFKLWLVHFNLNIAYVCVMSDLSYTGTCSPMHSPCRADKATPYTCKSESESLHSIVLQLECTVRCRLQTGVHSGISIMLLVAQAHPVYDCVFSSGDGQLLKQCIVTFIDLNVYNLSYCDLMLVLGICRTVYLLASSVCVQ